MRCPHCAALHVSTPVCAVCGLAKDAPVADAKVPGLEPTRAPVIESPPIETLPDLEPTRQSVGPVTVDPVPDIITNAEVLGETVILDELEPEPEPESPLICRACGVPNPPARVRCLACGKRLVT